MHDARLRKYFLLFGLKTIHELHRGEERRVLNLRDAKKGELVIFFSIELMKKEKLI